MKVQQWGRQREMAGLLSAVMLMVWPCATALADFTLVENGEARAVIVLPEDPEEREQLAADELIEHIRLMTGAELSVVRGEPDGEASPIYLGGAADESLDTATGEAGENPSSFTLRVSDGRIDIRGLSDEGTLFGTYELLEQLGFRWYMPGDLGRVAPDGQSARVSEQTTSQAPTMVWRHLQNVSSDIPWTRHVRLGGDERSTGRHGIPGLPIGDFDENPEWYSWDATRQERRPRQDCLSNPEVLARATEGIRREAAQQGGDVQYVGAASHDGGGYCECDGCRALDQEVYDPTADRESMTDRYIWFFNQVLDNLEEEFPNLHIVTYTYGAHMMPPKIDANPRIVPVFAPITIDRTRGMDNPMSPDRHLLRWLIDEWSARGVKEMYYRGYYGNLACPTFPFSQLDRIRHETPAFHEKGITVMRVEVIDPSWSASVPGLYLAARMMWDVETDVDALLEEFYELFYGPASEPMKRYHEQLESAFRDTPHMTGSSYLYLPIFVGHPRREELRSHLDGAAAAAGDPETSIYGERVAAIRLGWDRLEAFLDMMDSRNDHDFAAAFEAMQRFNDLTDQGVETMLTPDIEISGNASRWHPRLVPWYQRTEWNGNYFNRFFRRPTVEGHRRTVEIGQIVAPLPDEWLFIIDPSESGRLMGYQRPGELGGNWQPMKTSSRSWSDQGLHFYKGIAWYRTKVDIPAEFEGRPIYLWFGGVDRLASVWINGEYMGTSAEPREGLPGIPGSFRPFDMPTVAEDGNSALKFGEENWVVVEIENKSLAELGTGGILAPVMFWTPNDPNWDPGEEE